MTTLVEMDEDMQLPSVKWFLEKSGNKKVLKRKNFKTCVTRPPYSYSQIIVHAFIYHGFRKLALYEIYDFFLRRYSYFRQEKSSWRNSVRHLLSLDKRFIKVPREKGERGKGAFWLLDKDAVEEDGTLKPLMVTRQYRKMPVSKINKREETTNVCGNNNNNNAGEIKPHINPVVQKYIERIRLTRQDSNESSGDSFMTSSEVITPPDSHDGSLIPICYEYETVQSPCINGKEQHEPSQPSPEYTYVYAGDVSANDEDMFIFNFDNINFDLPPSDKFDELLDDDFLQLYSSYSDEFLM